MFAVLPLGCHSGASRKVHRAGRVSPGMAWHEATRTPNPPICFTLAPRPPPPSLCASQTDQALVSARSAASAGALSLPDSARQREQAAALEAALQHSAAEVQDLLGALDTAAAAAAATGAAAGTSAADGVPADQARAEAGAASEAALASLRERLAGRHQAVQAAAARMQAAAADAEQLKAQHAGLRQRVSWLSWVHPWCSGED